METHPRDGFEDSEDRYAREVPEDVAVLYSWANLEGAKYRDFSANRREHRAQMRQRAAEQVRESELKAQAEAEVAANDAETASATAHAAADAAASKLAFGELRQGSRVSGVLDTPWGQIDQERQVKQSSIRIAAQEARKASVEREAAGRRAKAAALASAQAQREEQEVAAARASATRRAALYAEAGLRVRTSSGSNADTQLDAHVEDPHPSRRWEKDEVFGFEATAISEEPAPQPSELRDTVWGSDLDDVDQEAELPAGRNDSAATWGISNASTSDAQESRAEVVRRIPGVGGTSSFPDDSAQPEVPTEPVSLFETATHAMSELFEAEPVSDQTGFSEGASHLLTGGKVGTPLTAPSANHRSKLQHAENSSESGLYAPGPAWLYPRQHQPVMNRTVAISNPGYAPETLERSKERIATRWFALRGVFARQDADRSNERPSEKAEHKQSPLAAVFSIAGGVGKTTLVATLGRALSFLGERVLLSDTTSHGLLPFYFGASQLVPGVVRTFSPPSGSADAPIHLVSYDAGRESEEPEGQAGIVDDLLENSQRVNRVLIDLSVNRSKMVARLARFKPTILVPLLADMNSTISIETVEKLFGSMRDEEGQPLQPVYFLNQFDSSSPLHLDIREILKQQLGDRLLPFVIRRSSAIGEALAEGMTVVDYDPASAVAEDYLRIANWLRNVSAPVAVGFRNQRWSEQ